MEDEIRLELKTIKDSSSPLDWVPIVGRIRMNRFSATRSMTRKMMCFGWNFDGFTSSYEGTTYRVYDTTVTAKDNYSHHLRFCRPEIYYAGKAQKVFEWLFLNTLWLYRICRWIWLITLIVGCALLKTNTAVGLLLALIPICVILLSNLFCLIGKRLNKKAKIITEIVLEENGYDTKWGHTDKDILAISKKIKKH